MTSKITKDKQLYDKHLKSVQKKNPKVNLILDVTKEDSDWLRQGDRSVKPK